jgi:curli biogenesis system outer membrane secretion channel CsgG
MLRVYQRISLCLSLALAGCTSIVPVQEDVAPLTGPAPRLNTTPMAPALACMATQGRSDLRIGVADFVDGTGVMEGGTQNSRALSQRPDMMMTVALSSAGAHLVNRSSVNVAEWEMNKAMEKKLGDGRTSRIHNQKVDFRPIKVGILLGSTHYVTGAITELNWNLSSNVAEGGAFSVSAGRRTYRISIAVDVVVTNTQTTEIVHARSYKKQLVGFETNANYFRFMHQDTAARLIASGNVAAAATSSALELFQANLGEKQNEPTQTALRWVIELAAYDIMRHLKPGGTTCDRYLVASGDEDFADPRVVLARADNRTDIAPEKPQIEVAQNTPVTNVAQAPAAIEQAKQEEVAAATAPAPAPAEPEMVASAPTSQIEEPATKPARKKREAKSLPSKPRDVTQVTRQEPQKPKKRERVERIDSAEIEALIEADRQRNAQKASQSTPVAASEPVAVTSGWMSGSVPAPDASLSHNTWKGTRQ